MIAQKTSAIEMSTDQEAKGQMAKTIYVAAPRMTQFKVVC